MPFDGVVHMTSVSIKPHIIVRLIRVWTTDFLVIIIWYKLLKHVVDVLICDDWQRRVPSRTKLSRFIPTQHWTVSVETTLLVIHWIALAECRYDMYFVQQNKYVSYKTWRHDVRWTLYISNGYIEHSKIIEHKWQNEWPKAKANTILLTPRP